MIAAPTFRLFNVPHFDSTSPYGNRHNLKCFFVLWTPDKLEDDGLEPFKIALLYFTENKAPLKYIMRKYATYLNFTDDVEFMSVDLIDDVKTTLISLGTLLSTILSVFQIAFFGGLWWWSMYEKFRWNAWNSHQIEEQ